MTTSHSNGSQTTSGTTEHTLGTITTAGVYQLQLDLNDMVNSDILEVRVKIKVRSTGTTREVFQSIHGHIQTSPVLITAPIAITNEVVFTVKAAAGTVTIPWEIIQVDG